MSHVPTRIKARRIAVTGMTTALVGSGLAVATAGTAHADSVWDRVAACESGGNWSINTGNGYHGGLQFTPSTWRAYGGSGSAAGASKSEQIRVAKNVLKGQGPGAWPVCSRKAGLTRSNGGASSASAGVSSSRSEARKATTSKKKSTTPKKTYKKVTSSTPKTYTSKASGAKTYTSKASGTKTYTAKKAAKRTSTVTPSTGTTYTTQKVSVSPKRAVAASVAAPAAFYTYFSNAASVDAIKAIQTKLDVPADGIVGPVTSRAVQDYVGTTQDGIIGKNTIRAMEKKADLDVSGDRKVDTELVKAFAAYLAK